MTVHGTLMPLSRAVQVDGRGIPWAPLSLKPKDVDTPAATDPFQDALLAVRIPALTLPTEFHGAEMVFDHGKLICHPVEVIDGVTFTSTVRPLPHSVAFVTTTSMPPAGAGAGVGAGAGAGAIRDAQ
jgi:hypothetical protein